MRGLQSPYPPRAKFYARHFLSRGSLRYLYTFDQKFTAGVKAALNKGALDGKDIFLKNEYKSFTLTKEQRTMITDLLPIVTFVKPLQLQNAYSPMLTTLFGIVILVTNPNTSVYIKIKPNRKPNTDGSK